MTSEEQINDVIKKPEEKKTGEDTYPEYRPTVNIDDVKLESKGNKSHELMRLVYELPEEDEHKEIIDNNNMLKESPPLRIVEITEQNGCESEMDKAFVENCDNNYLKVEQSSPEDNLGNKVVYDVLATNDLILNCAEEFKEVIERPPSDECSDEDLAELKKILESKPNVLERYIRESASNDEVLRLHNLTSASGPLSPRPHYEARSTSVTSDLFQLWLSSSPIKVSDKLY